METVTAALVGFCGSQTTMLDTLPSLGHIPKLFRAMAAKNDAIPKSAVQLAHALAVSKVCVRAMAQTDCVGKIQLAIKRRGDVTALACETYMRMFDSNEETLVEQVRAT